MGEVEFKGVLSQYVEFVVDGVGGEDGVDRDAGGFGHVEGAVTGNDGVGAGGIIKEDGGLGVSEDCTVAKLLQLAKSVAIIGPDVVRLGGYGGVAGVVKTGAGGCVPASVVNQQNQHP